MIEDYENIPNEMRIARRWLLWKSIPNQDTTKKPRKVPFYVNGNMRSGELDSPSDNIMLSTLETAVKALDSGQYTGLGFALGSDGTGNYWQGVDFDEVSKNPELGYMVEDLPGYTELSPSGDGWHSIGYGRHFDSLGSNRTGIEAYSSGRYFTVTGECSGISPPCCIADFVEQRLKPIHSKVNGHHKDQESDIESVSSKTIACLRSALLFMRSDDRELWQRNGHRLKKLGDVGRGLWMEWSATSDKFDPSADAKTWDSFKPTHTGYKAIFSEAQKLGWVNPISVVIEPVIEVEQETEWLNADELAENASAPDFLINNIIESKTNGLIAGSSQSFKSFCVLKMAHSICTGNDFFGFDVFTTGKVLYICGEGMGALGRRIKAIRTVDEGFNDNFFVLNRPLFIDNIAEMAWLKESINKINPVFVIFDTFSSLATATKENVNEEVARVLRMVSDSCIESGASSIVVHHYGKDAEKGTRGASAFGANIDYEISMKRIPDTLNAIVSCKKSKDGDYFDDIEITAHIVDIGLIRQDGGKATSLILKRSSGEGSLTPRQIAALLAIKETIHEDGHYIDGMIGITERQVKDCFNVAFEHEGNNKYRLFGKLIPSLKKKGEIIEKNGYFFLKTATPHKNSHA
jgi:hypothetical protein